MASPEPLWLTYGHNQESVTKIQGWHEQALHSHRFPMFLIFCVEVTFKQSCYQIWTLWYLCILSSIAQLTFFLVKTTQVRDLEISAPGESLKLERSINWCRIYFNAIINCTSWLCARNNRTEHYTSKHCHAIYDSSTFLENCWKSRSESGTDLLFIFLIFHLKALDFKYGTLKHHN